MKFYNKLQDSKTKSKKIIVSFLFLFSFHLLLKAQTTAPTDEAENKRSELLRRESFEKVWQTINEKHYDPTFGGVDWKKIREIYEPKAMSAKSLKEFHGILNQMVGELKLSHFGVYENKLSSLFEKAQSTGNGSETKPISLTTAGIEIKIVEGKPVISKVEKDSNAEKVGLRAGYIIEEINGKSIREISEKLGEYLTEIKATDNLKRIYLENLLNVMTREEACTKVEFVLIDEEGKRRTFSVEKYTKNVNFSQPVGYSPPQPIIFEAKRLENNIGYISFNVWAIPKMENLRKAIRDFADTKGIIFDLRGNPGGVSGIASGLAGLLTEKRISLGKMKGRGTELELIAYPQPNPYLGKVVILIDYATGSTSEIFSVGLQENGRAIIIGERSAGVALPSVIEILPTGAFFQYAIMDYKTPQGKTIEGVGVKPDLEVFQTIQAFLNGEDLPLKEAIKILNESDKNP
jgi:carboxyl-terminal processing protease